jgi:hypothetical protein
MWSMKADRELMELAKTETLEGHDKGAMAVK